MEEVQAAMKKIELKNGDDGDLKYMFKLAYPITCCIGLFAINDYSSIYNSSVELGWKSTLFGLRLLYLQFSSQMLTN